METQFVDNFIPKEFQDSIEQELIKDKYFPWYPNWSTIDETLQYDHLTGIAKFPNSQDTPQMFHMAVNAEIGWNPSSYYNFLKPLSYFIEDRFHVSCNGIIRLKANLLLKHNTAENFMHHPHIDQVEPSNLKSLIYYVNDSDGDTVTFNEYFNNEKRDDLTIEKVIAPKKGRAVLLDSTRFHTSSSPVKNCFRCVVNILFLSE